MNVGFGLITCQRHPADERGWHELYREAVELCTEAERLGFHSVWLSEHHFVDDGYMPSLMVTAAAIAQATTTIRIGTGLVLAPLYDPLRLAEDAATVELISGGRLILGLGAGWREEEFEAFGVPIGERAARVRETVAVLRRAWSGKAFSYDGRVHRVDNVAVTPVPSREIPIWIGGFSRGAQLRAGRIGDGFLYSSSRGTGIDRMVEARGHVMEGRRSSKRQAFTFALHAPVFVWDDGALAWDLVRPWYHYLSWKYADMGPARGHAWPGPHPPRLDADREETLRRGIVCGGVDDVVAQIQRVRDALGGDITFVCRSYFPGMPWDVQCRSLEILGSRVLPRLRT